VIETAPFNIVSSMETLRDKIAYVREGLGLSQEEFADALNERLEEAGEKSISRGAIGNWESRKTPKAPSMTNLRAISELAEASLDWLVFNKGDPPAAETLRRRGDRFRADAVFRSISPEPMAFPGTVPVFGQAAGATLDNGASVLFDQPPIGQLPLLPGLVGLRDVYGLEVTGDSMLPMFRPRDPVYVSPHSPVHRDDPIIITEHHSRNGAAVTFIKLLQANRAEQVVARQLNPPLELKFMKKPGLSIHRVLTLREALGYGAEPDVQIAPPPRRRTARRR